MGKSFLSGALITLRVIVSEWFPNMFPLKYQFSVLLEHLHLLTRNVTSMTLTLLPSPRANPKPFVVIPYLKVILFLYFIFSLELTSVLISPARDIAFLYSMSVDHPLLEMVLVLFAPPFHEDLVCLLVSISF